jgi:prenylcysteine oxidase/farnesylcysteine lyase
MHLNRKYSDRCVLFRADETCSSFISAMETETLASRNVVDLLLREKFNSSICLSNEEKREGESAAFVYGWDC